jgi:hypothetical protein
MIRVLVALFWIALIVGTYATGNVVENWLVCLLGLFLFIRSRRRRQPAPEPRAIASSAPVGPHVARVPVPDTASAPRPFPHRARLEPGARRRWR